MKQLSFTDAEHQQKKKQTKRDKFLQEMDRVVPWGRFLEFLEPYYPKSKGPGQPPIELETMLRIYFLQQWFELSDPGAEEALYDMASMRRFAGISLGKERIPDETTILNFRHLLERHNLTQGLFEQVQELLEEKGLLLKQGTIVDATMIAAPSSTKNQDKKRDAEMSSTKKANQWHEGSYWRRCGLWPSAQRSGQHCQGARQQETG